MHNKSTHPSLNVVKECETFNKLKSRCRCDLQFELSILQLSDEAIDFLSGLDWQDIIDDLNKNVDIYVRL